MWLYAWDSSLSLAIICLNSNSKGREQAMCMVMGATCCLANSCYVHTYAHTLLFTCICQLWRTIIIDVTCISWQRDGRGGLHQSIAALFMHHGLASLSCSVKVSTVDFDFSRVLEFLLLVVESCWYLNLYFFFLPNISEPILSLLQASSMRVFFWRVRCLRSSPFFFFFFVVFELVR